MRYELDTITGQDVRQETIGRDVALTLAGEKKLTVAEGAARRGKTGRVLCYSARYGTDEATKILRVRQETLQ